jgi:predicted transcriptional regulator
MAKEAVFTMKLEPELRDAFMAEAAELDRPASQIVRDLMKDFIRRREEEKQGYVDFLARKVAAARRDVAEGRTYTQDEVRERMRERLRNLEARNTGEADH